MKQNQRELWIDVAKGIGIITVVIGHSGNQLLTHYFYWFHMPLFFALSGYTFKPIQYRTDLTNFIRKRGKQLLIPYLSFGVVIIAISFLPRLLRGDFDFPYLIKSLALLVYGGNFLVGPFNVFWFITCLFLTQIIFALITYFIKNIWIQFSIITVAFVLAHIQAFSDVNSVPWSAEVSLLSLTYYSLGYYGKNFIKTSFNNKATIASITIACIALLIIDRFKIIDYRLDMKVHVYNNFLLDFIIPSVFVLFILVISKWIASIPISKYLSNIGTMSLTIMYLHLTVTIILARFIGKNDLISFTIVGLSIPILIHILILNRFKFTKILFLGKVQTKTQKINLGQTLETRY